MWNRWYKLLLKYNGIEMVQPEFKKNSLKNTDGLNAVSM